MTRFAQTTAFLLLGLLQAKFASSIEVGDEVCLTGYIMDNFCVENVVMLDKSQVKTLEQPEEHSFYCLLDVGICIESGFQVLGPKNPETGMHCGGFRIDNDESDVVLEAGRSLGRPGYCSTCEGNQDGPEYGYSATVRGTVSELGDGSDDDVKGTPILKNVRVTNNEECEAETAPPLCTHLREVTNEPTDPSDIDPLNDAEGASSDEGENVSDPPVAAPVEESETTAADTSEGVVGEPSELDEVNSSVFAHSSIAVVAGFASMLLLAV
mmetsp:Transcript_22403/g.49789  ORF Transcript_22403/g.49789 Transcript_22403/m.49789 type:complete len:268 (+) Transcript_22403:291-1094(+)